MAMSETVKLFHDDPLLLCFRARVVGHGRSGSAPSVILDRTAFYPEAGGQMADHGALGGLPVTDVQIDDAGLIHHVLAGPLPDLGVELDGAVERARRRVHMALHTGQHMLSRALVDEARADTVSSRLGETACTIDVDRADLPEGELARAEALANAVIDDDAPIRSYFPEPDELARLPLRRPPKVTDHVRVVAIGAFDVSPCGGTHCLRTAQVGFVRVTGVERYKGKTRVTFVSGRRAREELAGQAAALVKLGRDFSCAPTDVPAAIAKLRSDLQDAREALGAARARLVNRLADELLCAPTPEVAAFLDDGDLESLRILAKRITDGAGRVALLAASTPAGIQILAARGIGIGFDCGAFVKRVAAAHGGRGGGGPDRAEGRIPLGAIDAAGWAALIRS